MFLNVFFMFFMQNVAFYLQLFYMNRCIIHLPAENQNILSWGTPVLHNEIRICEFSKNHESEINCLP